jgi:hypothetical protein
MITNKNKTNIVKFKKIIFKICKFLLIKVKITQIQVKIIITILKFLEVYLLMK